MQALVLALKAIPILKDFFDKFIELWITHQEYKDETIMVQKYNQREALIKSLSNPNLTNGERSELRRLLYAVDH